MKEKKSTVKEKKSTVKEKKSTVNEKRSVVKGKGKAKLGSTSNPTKEVIEQACSIVIII